MKNYLLRALLLATMCAGGTRAIAQVTIGFEEPRNIVVMSVPDSTVALQIDLLHLKLERNQLDGSATRRKLQASDGHGWVLSAFIYPLDKKQSALELNEEAFGGLRKAAAETKFRIEGMKVFERGEISLREYIIPEFRGKPVHQKNVFGYATSGNMGVDFHISKLAYSPAEDKFFDLLINGARLLQDYRPDSAAEFGYGSIYYLHQEWATASLHYEKALQQEKQKRALNQTQWNVLVDNLGMAYGMAGDLAKAKAVYEYGIKENPTYPMFHYNMACAEAELGNRDAALDQLRAAFQYKSGSIPGEGIPDPIKDDSFKRYVSDPQFTKLARELCPSSTNIGTGWECQ